MNLTVIEWTALVELLLATLLAYQRSKEEITLKARTERDTLRRRQEAKRGRETPNGWNL